MGNGAIKPPQEIPEQMRQDVFRGDSCCLDAVAKYIKEGRAKQVVVLVGAGASVSAGIPDFRTPGTGLYSNLQKYNLPEGKPESVFDLEFFEQNPLPFYLLAKELYPGQHAPTPCHRFIKLLHDKNILRRVYTQNIDGLERLAGLPEDKIIQCHGGFDAAQCVQCKATSPAIDPDWLKSQIMAGILPICPECGAEGKVKPAITFFGEKLSPRFGTARDKDFLNETDGRSKGDIQAHEDIRKELSRASTSVAFGLKDAAELEPLQAALDVAEAAKKQHMQMSCACDLLIVFGTSLKVQPVSSLPDFVHWLCPRVLINREKVHIFGEPYEGIRSGDNGFRFDFKDNYRDVFVQNDCDIGARELANLIGWGI